MPCRRRSHAGRAAMSCHPVGTIRQAFETLTQREREVMAGVTAGRMNKEIAAHIGLSEATVKLHRGQVMRKMGATSVCTTGAHGRETARYTKVVVSSTLV